jgi:hypothetical protein
MCSPQEEYALTRVWAHRFDAGEVNIVTHKIKGENRDYKIEKWEEERVARLDFGVMNLDRFDLA